MVRGDEGAGEEGDSVEVEFAGREKNDGGADDEAGNGEVVEEFPLVGGGGIGCSGGG